MSLSPGTKPAHYEVLEPIAKGGMGEVDRARDGKLGRDVAIKVLPDEFAKDERAPETISARGESPCVSQSSEHRLSSYGLELSDKTHYLVLELVPGETLAERISRGPIPLEEALGKCESSNLLVSAAILVRSWTRPKSLPRWTPPVAGSSSPRATRSRFPRLGRSNVRRLTRAETTIRRCRPARATST